MMFARKDNSLCVIGIVLLALASGCSQDSTSTSPEVKYAVKKPAPGQEFSGFLGDYSMLEPDPELEGAPLTWASEDVESNLREYIAIIVDPVEVFIQSDVDEALIPEAAVETVSNYFQYALRMAVSDAFPVADGPGPLVMRLRAAVVGIDVGGELDAAGLPEGEALPRAVNIGEVVVEMELVDSETGERIAAVVDKAPLGQGAEVGAESFSRVERFRAAKEAFDEWAERVRDFLDVEHELSEEAAQRASDSYRPYGEVPE
jgi:hypothetical protein